MSDFVVESWNRCVYPIISCVLQKKFYSHNCLTVCVQLRQLKVTSVWCGWCNWCVYVCVFLLLFWMWHTFDTRICVPQKKLREELRENSRCHNFFVTNAFSSTKLSKPQNNLKNKPFSFRTRTQKGEIENSENRSHVIWKREKNAYPNQMKEEAQNIKVENKVHFVNVSWLQLVSPLKHKPKKERKTK